MRFGSALTRPHTNSAELFVERECSALFGLNIPINSSHHVNLSVELNRSAEECVSRQKGSELFIQCKIALTPFPVSEASVSSSNASHTANDTAVAVRKRGCV